MARQSAHTLIWEGLEGAGLLDGVSLGEVDAGLVRETDWDPGHAPVWDAVDRCQDALCAMVA